MIDLSFRRLVVLWVFLAFLFITAPGPAAFAGPVYAPPDLEPWKPWVLHGLEYRGCPTVYNDDQVYHCTWPSRLKLEVEPRSGRFTQEWLVLTDSWVGLPGEPGLWPQNVLVNGGAATVIGVDQTPSIFLPAGRYRIEGGFTWSEVPETIPVPSKSGLVALFLNGRRVDFPVMDQTNRLWVQKKVEPQGQADRLDVRILRLIKDDIPMRTVDLVKLNVSGRAREIALDGVLLDGAVPMSLDSPLPARLAPNGTLTVQARPGRWEVFIESRFQGPVMEIGPITGGYGRETWAFQSNNHLRMVKVSGAPALDPGQTDLPGEWQSFPAYLMDPEANLVFSEIRRGDPDPAPDRLNLRRIWWLDSDGGGFTVHDALDGAMSRSWFLAMNAPGQLGRVVVDGRDQLITGQGPEGKAGVELRRGTLNLEADSRLEGRVSQMPAVGWDHDFQSLSGVLNLPAGWRLVTARGVDVLPGTWFQRWTLLDFFLVLIIALAVFKLKRWWWGLLALATLAVIYHEPGAPRLVWMNLLAATALLRLLPAGWAKRLAGLWRLASIIVLLVLAIPFMVGQIRVGLYPQLDTTGTPWGYAAGIAGFLPQAPAPASPPPDTKIYRKRAMDLERLEMGRQAPDMSEAPEPEQYLAMAPPVTSDEYQAGLLQGARQAAPPKKTLEQDPGALIQTGPGLPTWGWRSYEMKWNGPVDRTQTVRLWLLSPSANLFLAFLRVILLAVLIVGLIDFKRWREMTHGLPTGAAGVLVLLLLPVMASAGSPVAAYPPPEILQELQNRLLEPPDCMPYCADFPRLDLIVTDEEVRMMIEVHAGVDTAAPLPGDLRSWQASEVFLDQMPADGLLRDENGVLWLLVPAGVHQVVMRGPTPRDQAFQIPLPLRPRQTMVTAENWEVLGIRPGGQVEASLQFTRSVQGGPEPQTAPAGNLAPFLQVRRTLNLGLDWQVVTSVVRMTPAGSPVVASIPLLDGESVTTAGLQVVDGMVQINMDAAAQEVVWTSSLKEAPEIRLAAPRDAPWVETWELNASPIWHPELSGIPVIHHQDADGQWQPLWRPWPGETVAIRITRPQAVPGQVVTVDQADLEWTPGQRFHKGVLDLTIRASQGGQHAITLPEGARLQQVTINGRSQPIGAEGRTVTVPLRPQKQVVRVEWHQDSPSGSGLEVPEVGIGQSAVNASVTVNMPRNRWVLWTSGPRMGPTVLFWTYLVVIVLAAAALGRVSWTPLKTRHWLLLGLGLTQLHPLAAILIVGWILALGVRREHRPPEHWLAFDGAQLLLTLWTLAALIALYVAVERGLLGIPDMQIAGNGSTDLLLRWYQDRIGTTMPQPVVWSLPKLVYHLFMLVWALWLALSLLKWLHWGWTGFSGGGIWRKPGWRWKKHPEAETFQVE